MSSGTGAVPAAAPPEREPLPASGAPSIAVLPFRNLSADPESEYFSDGITEELLNSLAQLRGLKVAARTSSFAFKNQAVDLRTVAGRLGVGTVLEGSVRRQGQRVRITAQLVNVSDGYQLWSEAFDRQLDDVFAIQADIAERVADALRLTLLQSDAERLRSPDTRNPDAYDAYLHGLQQMASFGVESVLEAARSFQRAAELDPQFAKAYAGVANAYLFAYETSAIPLEQLLRIAEPAMERAMALEPWLSEAQAARGGVLAARRNAAGAKAAFRRALELNPGNTLASHLYGMFLWHQWDLEEMLEVYNRALRIDPLDATLQALRGFGTQTLGHMNEAQADFARARSLDSAPPRRGPRCSKADIRTPSSPWRGSLTTAGSPIGASPWSTIRCGPRSGQSQRSEGSSRRWRRGRGLNAIVYTHPLLFVEGDVIPAFPSLKCLAPVDDSNCLESQAVASSRLRCGRSWPWPGGPAARRGRRRRPCAQRRPGQDLDRDVAIELCIARDRPSPIPPAPMAVSMMQSRR